MILIGRGLDLRKSCKPKAVSRKLRSEASEWRSEDHSESLWEARKRDVERERSGRMKKFHVEEAKSLVRARRNPQPVRF